MELSWAREMQASAGFWPGVSISAGYTESDDPVNVFGMLLRQERFTSADFDLNRLNTPRHQRDLQGGVHLRWPLFDAMQTVRRARVAREQVKAAQADEAFVKMETFLMAHDAFTSALAMDRLLVAAEEAEKAAQADLKKAETLKDKGLVLGADYYAARVRYGRFSQAKNDMLRQVKAMRMLLNIMMGEPIKNEIALPAALPDADFADTDAVALLEKAVASRPDFVAAGARINAGQEEVKRAKDSALPTITLTADGTNNRHDLFGHGGNNASGGIVAELPLFDRTRAGRQKEAVALLSRAQNEAAALKDATAVDISRESARFDALRANYPVVRAMAEDAAKAVELLLPLYNEGRRSVMDLEDAREARFNTLNAVEELKAALYACEARLYFLGGKMDEAGMKALTARLTGAAHE